MRGWRIGRYGILVVMTGHVAHRAYLRAFLRGRSRDTHFRPPCGPVDLFQEPAQ